MDYETANDESTRISVRQACREIRKHGMQAEVRVTQFDYALWGLCQHGDDMWHWERITGIEGDHQSGPVEVSSRDVLAWLGY